MKPRIDRIRAQYPDARTTSSVLLLLKSIPATEFLNWNEKDHSERFSRTQRFRRVLDLFATERIEVEADLKIWLSQESNLLKLRFIKGIGPKTIDYFKILVGIAGSAIDMHLLNFLKLAGLTPRGYRDAQVIINATADRFSVNQSLFDHSIWQFMRKRGAGSKGGECDGQA